MVFILFLLFEFFSNFSFCTNFSFLNPRIRRADSAGDSCQRRRIHFSRLHRFLRNHPRFVFVREIHAGFVAKFVIVEADEA